MSTKPTNPKDALGLMKTPLHLLSPIVKAYQSVAHYLGNVKYGAHNFRAGGARASVYKAACERHLDAWWEGEKMDRDGTPHLANALACIGILIETSALGNLVDDRPPSSGRIHDVHADVEAMMKVIYEKYGEMNPRHWTIADTSDCEKGWPK